MGLIVRALEIYTPEFVRRRALTELFSAAAGAFEAEVPPLGGLDSAGCLAEYARFTQAHAGQCLRDGHALGAIEQRLYRNSFELGRLNARWFRPARTQDVMAVGRVLYRILDIDLQGDAGGDIVIRRCYFSRYYSPEVCRLMSAMDRGLFAGLSNGGELYFSGRITEGQPCCRAHFAWALPE